MLFCNQRIGWSLCNDCNKLPKFEFLKKKKGSKKIRKKERIISSPKTYRDYSLEQQQALIDEGKSFTVRLKIPDGITEFTDLVYGTIKVNNKELDDFIIARSDDPFDQNVVFSYR